MIRSRPLRTLLLLSLPLAATACVTHFDEVYVGGDDYVIARRDGAAGATEVYELSVTGGGDAALSVATEYDKDRTFLGFQLAEIDKSLAESRGLRPYSGLLVQGVYSGSAAELAGVVNGDLLYELGGRETIYRSQVADVEAGLDGGQDIVATIGRGGDRIELTLTGKRIRERVTDRESVALESSGRQVHRPHAGVHLRGIPATWCEKIWGEPREAVVVSRVEVGSPAWLAGLRGGDIIDEVDGRPVPSVSELSREIAARGEAERPMLVTVSRGDDPPFEARIDLCDYSGETNVWIPLVFGLRNGVYQDRWSFGPFGLLMSNRNSYVADTTTREVQTRNVFHALLGLIKVDSRPEETRVRLLWFISFDT